MEDKIRSRDPRIERLHLVDLDVAPLDGETVDEAIVEITTGLLVQGQVLIADSGNGWPVVRFTGPRSQIEELLNRYDGVPGALSAAPWNPDPGSGPRYAGMDPEFARTMAGH